MQRIEFAQDRVCIETFALPRARQRAFNEA